MSNNNDGKILNFPGATKTPVPQPQTVQVTTPKPEVKGQGIRDKGRGLSPFAKRREELRPQLTAQYGQLSEDDINKLVLAEMDKDPCARCNCECSKAIARWRIPVVRVEDSKAFVEYALCPVGVKRFERREFERAGIPKKFHDKTFSDYTPKVSNNDGKAVAREILHAKNPKNGYFYGGVGEGKTFLAALVAQDFVRDLKLVRFLNQPTDELPDCDLFILDDIGTWEPTCLAAVFNQCYDKGQLFIATANCALDELKLDAKTKSRVRATTTQAFFGINNWRRFK